MQVIDQHLGNYIYYVASFPGSPRMRTKNRKERGGFLQATESWAGPGNEAIYYAV